MKRKSNNEGSIRQRKDGRWEVRATGGMDYATGKPKRISRYAKTKAEAVDLLHELEYQIHHMRQIDPTSTTLADWLRYWLETYKMHNLKQSTYVSYRGYIEKHVAIAFPTMKLKDLTARELQEFYNFKISDGLSPKTILNIHRCLHEALKQADVSKTETADAVEETIAVNQKNETEHETEKGENGRYEVLIVDDNPDFLQFMTDTLKDKYHVRRAEDGKQALQAISEHHPDIILSDVMMPEMDGNELCSAVKNNPETAKIPFVLLTARMAQEQKISSLERGADDYITKPFDLDLLHLRIDNLIKWSHSGGKTAKLEPKVKELEITSLDEKLVNDATEYVEQNLTEVDLNVETLSAALNMSRSYLYKRILSLTGHTPSEFIRLIRLRHAEQLLRKSQLSVSEITYKVGFPNTRSFSKFFKEMYGILPSQYKDAHGV